VVAAGVVVAAVALAWYLLLQPVQRISTYSIRQIVPGMTRSQVEIILGGPAGDYRTAPLRPPDEDIRAQLPAGDCWLGDRHSAYVAFDAQDRVVNVTSFFPVPRRPSWYRALQEWMPLPD
jgi:hypothetical protein